MKPLTNTFFLIICLVLFTTTMATANNRTISRIRQLTQQNQQIGDYRALLIGIENYNDPSVPDLETPLKDIREMEIMLKTRYGFKVTKLLDKKATRKAMDTALRGLVKSSKPEDSVLIYYAGHGQIDHLYNSGWWIPVDARSGDHTTYLDNVQVQKTMQAMKAKHVLLISDSCYSGTLFGTTKAMPAEIDENYYKGLFNERSRWGMTSGNKTPVADYGTAGHSIFAYQLLKALKSNNRPYVSAQEIYTGIAHIIGNNSEQTPLCKPIRNTGDQGGQFIFIASDTPLPQRKRGPQPGESWKDPVTGMVFIWVPKGCFDMGQTDAEKQYLIKIGGQEFYDKHVQDELPRHKVCVDGFWMGKFEVTRGVFRQFIKATGYRTDAEKKGSYNWQKTHFSQEDNHPVVNVSWNDAQAFIQWLNKQTGQEFALPTEAQWEYACRGGTDTMRFWGDGENNACQYGNFRDTGNNWSNAFPCDDGYTYTAPVGSYQYNRFGLHDILGNVWEWCQDIYAKDAYEKHDSDNPIYAQSGSLRVNRGGSWYFGPADVRCADRYWGTPDYWIDDLGFRLCRTQ